MNNLDSIMNNNNLLMGLCTLTMTGASLYMFLNNRKNKQKTKNKEEPDVKEISKYMKLELENQMIRWKTNNKEIEDNYYKFIQDVYPENTKVKNGKLVWIDSRVMGTNWVTAFQNTHSGQKLHQLGNPPNAIIL